MRTIRSSSRYVVSSRTVKRLPVPSGPLVKVGGVLLYLLTSDAFWKALAKLLEYLDN